MWLVVDVRTLGNIRKRSEMPITSVTYQVKEDFFLFDQQRAMDATEIVAHTLRINPYRMVYGFDEKEKIRMASFDYGGVPTLSTLCCYIQDRPGLDGKQLVTRTVEEFLRNKGKHPDFENVLKEDAPKFLEYCTWVKNVSVVSSIRYAVNINLQQNNVVHIWLGPVSTIHLFP